MGEYGNAHRQLYSTRIFDRGEYKTVPSIDYNISRTYVVNNHGLKDYVTERDYEEVEAPFMAEQDKTLGLKELLLIEKEYEISSLMRNVATYPTGNSRVLSGDAQFSDYANSDPLKVFADARAKVYEVSRKRVNTAIIPYEVLIQLENHPKLTGIYGSKGVYSSISLQQIANALKIKNIMVPEASYIGAGGAETAFWGKDIVLYHQAPSASKRQRTFGYRIQKNGPVSYTHLTLPTTPYV